jgi:DNA helicase HerA-like ATPase
MREYLRVTPTSEEVAASDIPTVLTSLHKLASEGSGGLLNALNPLHSNHPPRFEFLALSEGKNEPVEFYYGVDEHFDTLETRLRSIYPTTFDIERVEVDLETKLVPTVEFSREEFAEAVNGNGLLYEYADEEFQPISADGLEHSDTDEAASSTEPPVGDGGTVVDEDSKKWIEIGDDAVAVGLSNARSPDDSQYPNDRPTLTDRDTILARPEIDSLHPRGVRWCGTAIRKKDWMTTLTLFTETLNGTSTRSTTPPLVTLIDQLSDIEHPIAFQIVFQRRDSWKADGDLRKEDLADGRDTLSQELLGPLLEVEDQSTSTKERKLTETVQDRIDRITAKNSSRTFTVNLRAVVVPPENGEQLGSQLTSLRPVFDSLDGPFYGLDGQPVGETGWRKATKRKKGRALLKRVLNRELTTGRGKTRPDLVLSGDELANFILVPSADQLSVEGTRGTRAEQQSRNPLPRPHQDIMREFRDGMTIGYPLSENGAAEDLPTHIPPGLLPTHYGRFGTTGSGKSKALINDILSLYENTEGPVILIDPKGDGMTQNYMRAHARKFGTTDLEENVIHFPVPDILPGFSFFDLEPSMERGRRRVDAVQRKADHYEEILKLVMGENRYERATVAPTLIKTLIKTLFDEEHGRENGLYRESTDYFAHRQLEYAVDKLWEAGPPQPNPDEAPQSGDEEVIRVIRRQLQLDAKTFGNVMGGVGNRLAYISQDTHLRRIFNNTENRFDFRDLIDENTIILFDLGDLREEAARIMTGVILTNLDDALKERKRDLAQYSDDYVVNLIVDEAASVVVSGIINDLLEKGRGFRLSVGLSMQFPEQMEIEGGRKVYLNALNNIGSSLIGKINVDRELARAMAHEEMDPVAFANRIRSLPRGEWIASLPSPTFGETGPYPFSIKPLPIPAGHPESDYPLTPREEAQFDETLLTIHSRATDTFGVPESTAPTTQTPAALREVLSVTDDKLDVALAKVVRSLQLRDGVREENGEVAVEQVDQELRRLFEDVEIDPPSYDELADIRQRTRFLETSVDLEVDEVVVRLTTAGEDVAAPDTGEVQAAGGSGHDDALLQIEEELTTLGFTVSILSQDGSEKPDGRATHPELDETFAIEVETTTPENPAKVLTNLRKAQQAGEIPLFVVRPGNSELDWAKRVEGILSPPVRELQSGEIRFYTDDSPITFNGGATEEGGVTAIRPVTGSDDNRRSIWVREDDSIVLYDGTGTEHVRLGSLSAVTKDRVPAIYSYDPTANEYLVYEPGETHTYKSKTAFDREWVPIKIPFVPEDCLPEPAFGSDSYCIVILHDESESVIYEDGQVRPLSTIVESTLHSASLDTSKSDRETEQTDTASGVEIDAQDEDSPPSFESFIEMYLVEKEDASVPKSEVYDCYLNWADAQGVDDPLNKSWFTRKLNTNVEVESKRMRVEGDLVRHYTGIDIRSEQDLR